MLYNYLGGDAEIKTGINFRHEVTSSFRNTFYSFHVQAQGVPEIPSQVPFSVSSNAVKSFDQRFEKIRGTPTLFDNYQEGKIRFTKEQERVMLMNYDAFNDQVLIKRDTGAAPFAIRKDVVENFIITQNGHDYEFERLTHNQKDGYFLKLSDGKAMLYCKVSKIIHRSKSDGAHYSETSPDEFLVLNQYYVKQNGCSARTSEIKERN